MVRTTPNPDFTLLELFVLSAQLRNHPLSRPAAPRRVRYIASICHSPYAQGSIFVWEVKLIAQSFVWVPGFGRSSRLSPGQNHAKLGCGNREQAGH